METGARRRFDLEERTYLFARDAALLCRTLPRSIVNIEYAAQAVRSSASVGANYIEANELKKIFSAIIEKSSGTEHGKDQYPNAKSQIISRIK